MKQWKNRKIHKSTHNGSHHIKKQHSNLISSDEHDELENLINNPPNTSSQKADSRPQLNIPMLASDFVANVIELIELAKLPTLAKIDYVITLLDELFRISLIFPNIREGDPSTSEIEDWGRKLEAKRDISWMNLFEKKLHDNLKLIECQKMEIDATRWLDNFRFQLKSLKIN